MLLNAKYAEPLLTRRKITAAARAAFTFPMEDILEPETLEYCKSAVVEMLMRAELYRGGSQRLPPRFHPHELCDFSGSQLAQDIAEQRTVSAADFLKLHAHRKIVHQIFHLRLDRHAHVKHVQHQAEVGPGAQDFRGRDARPKFRNLLHLAFDPLHPVDHPRLAVTVKPRTPTPVALHGTEAARQRAALHAVEIHGLVLVFHLHL